MLLWREVAGKGVASIEHRTHGAALHQVGPHACALELVWLAALLQVVHGLVEEVAVEVGQHVVAEQRAVANRIRVGFFRGA